MVPRWISTSSQYHRVGSGRALPCSHFVTGNNTVSQFVLPKPSLISLQAYRALLRYPRYSPIDMTTPTPLPYSVSTGSAYNAFDKLQGVKNYADWKDNMHVMLLSLRQWGMVNGSIARPIPVDANAVTADETTLIEAWDLRAGSSSQILEQC